MISGNSRAGQKSSFLSVARRVHWSWRKTWILLKRKRKVMWVDYAWLADHVAQTPITCVVDGLIIHGYSSWKPNRSSVTVSHPHPSPHPLASSSLTPHILLLKSRKWPFLGLDPESESSFLNLQRLSLKNGRPDDWLLLLRLCSFFLLFLCKSRFTLMRMVASHNGSFSAYTFTVWAISPGPQLISP